MHLEPEKWMGKAQEIINAARIPNGRTIGLQHLIAIALSETEVLARLKSPRCDDCGGPFPRHGHYCKHCVAKHVPSWWGKIVVRLVYQITKHMPDAAICPSCGEVWAVSRYM